MAPAKQGIQVAQVVEAMEAMEKRLKEWMEHMKTDLVEEVRLATGAQLAAVDLKLEQQGAQLEQMQMKVNLSLDSIGKIQQEQVYVAKVMKGPVPSPLVIPARDEQGIMGARPAEVQGPPPARSSPTSQHIIFPPPTLIQTELLDSNRSNDAADRRNWMPKMDFPKFNGNEARIWIDKCQTFFAMYQIPPGRVAAATMYLEGSAAHWYQAYKSANVWQDWEQFQQAVLSEFETNTHSNKMREMLQLKQTGTVEKYKKDFDRLVYHIRLYDRNIGEMLLVTQFVLGLKDELRAAV